MNVINTNIEGPVVIEPRLFSDSRGYFFESFSQRDFEQNVRKVNFVQDNESMSSYGVMRGLHFQKPPYAQSKLVRCVRGAVLDVAVDIRRGSATYGKHVACLLTGHDEEGQRISRELFPEGMPWLECQPSTYEGLQFFVPRGFAHGFAVLSKTAVFQYKCDNFYAPQADAGISILDTSLGIDWKIPLENAILSEKDKHHVCLEDFDSPFNISDNLYSEI